MLIWVAIGLLAMVWLWVPAVGPSAASSSYLMATVLLALATAMRWACSSRSTGTVTAIGPVVMPVAACALVCAIAAFSARSPLEATACAAAAIVIVQAAYVGSQGSIGSLMPTTWYLAPWIIAGIVSSLFALVQYSGNSAHFTPWVTYALPGEAYANLRQRNQFASLTNIAVASIFAWISSTSMDYRARAAVLMLSSCGVVLLAAANAASASRTGLLQLVGVSAIMVAWHRDRNIGTLVALAAIAYVTASLLLPHLAGLDPATHGMFARLKTGDAPCSSRLTLWANVLELIAQKPLAGWGWGELDYAHFMTLYEGPRFCDILDNAHNLPLHLAVELGVPVAVLFCTGILWWVIKNRPWREADPTRQFAWLVLLIVAIHSMFEYPLWYAPFQIAGGLCLGLLSRQPQYANMSLGASQTGRSGTSPTNGRVCSRTHEARHQARGIAPYAEQLKIWPLALSAFMMAGCTYAAWDYWRISQIYQLPEDRAPHYRYDTLKKIENSWLFRRQVEFAELTTTPVSPANAERTHALALELLHFSPEARVVEKLLVSAQYLGRDDEVRFFAARYRAAFPGPYEEWVSRQSLAR